MMGSSILGLKHSIQEVEKAMRKAAKRVKKEEDSPWDGKAVVEFKAERHRPLENQ